VTCTFSVSSGAESFTVPAGVTAITVDATGAAGDSEHCVGDGAGKIRPASQGFETHDLVRAEVDDRLIRGLQLCARHTLVEVDFLGERCCGHRCLSPSVSVSAGSGATRCILLVAGRCSHGGRC